MANPLPNTTTTSRLTDTVLSAGGPCSAGGLVIANNPVSVLITHGPEQGTTMDTLYPYIAPTTLPLVSGPQDYLYAVYIAEAIAGNHAQVSGFLTPLGLAGIGVGTAFNQTITAAGVVTVPGGELAYAEFTSPVSIAATTEPTANAIVTAPSITVDGATAINIEFMPRRMQYPAVGGASLTIVLYEDGASIGQMSFGNIGNTSEFAHVISRRFTPISGTHTYSIRGFVSSGTGTIHAGLGGSGNFLPGQLRITRAGS